MMSMVNFKCGCKCYKIKGTPFLLTPASEVDQYRTGQQFPAVQQEVRGYVSV